jgi:c-di-GMP-binding flagellar brake protein YcgR
MQMSPSAHGTQNHSPFQVDSRREIIALLRGLKESNQFVSMTISGAQEIFITSVLDLHEANNLLIIDSTPEQLLNQRIVGAPKVHFEGLLNKISIQFSSSSIQNAAFEGRPALQLAIPASLIRLQRREFYRICTPMVDPVRCIIPIENDFGIEQAELPVVDISGGGIAILDEKRRLKNTPGVVYENCSIDLPTTGIITMALSIRTSLDLNLLNGRTNRRIGCEFVHSSGAFLTGVQRYIMKLERERNAKSAGLI